MSKPHSFLALRMEFARQGQHKEQFRTYLKAEGFTDNEQKEIREAFLSIGTTKEVRGDRIFGND